MTNYSKTTNFTAKDSLVSGDANKIVKGSEIDAEFDNIATASATKANIASPAFTGVVSFPDGTAGDPSITNTGDTNTGLFFSAADTLAFSAAGTAQFTMSDGAIAPVTDNDVDLGTSSLEFKDGYFDGTVHTDAINLNGTAITSTAAEINILDGVTATAAELNILDGVTSTAAELNILDGVTSTAAELNILDGVTATTAELNYNDTGSAVGTVVASKVVTVDANKDVASFRNITLTGELDAGSLDISGDADIDGTLETDALSINGTAVTSTAAELNILDGVTSTAAELNILDGVTSTAAELNILDGVTATTAELNIMDGVTATTAELNIMDGVTASAADINLIDGITNGTVIASKAIITDSNKDITGGRNITISGELDAATLDISGDADIDGTLETDALSINGTAVTSTAAELNILDGVTSTAAELNILDGVTSTAAELNILDGVTSTAAELNILDGVTAVAGELNALDLGSTAVGIAIASKAVVLDSNKDFTGVRNFSITGDLSVAGTTTVVDSVQMTANNAVIFEGATADASETTLTSVDATADRTISLPNQSGTLPVLAAVSTTAITSTPEELNVLDGITAVVGELNALDLGSTAVGTAIASKAVILDSNKDYTGIRNFTISGELDAATLDISGDIDVDGTTNLDVVDIDGAVDMASTLAVAGVVTANAGVVVDNITIDGQEIDVSSGDLTLDVAGDIILDFDGGDLKFVDGGTEIGLITSDGSNFGLFSRVSDKDIIFYGNDGGSTITALTLDMSAAGAATFNSSVTADALTANGSSEGDTYFTGGTANSRLLNVFTSTHDGGANAGHNFKIASGQGAFIFGNATTANLLTVKTGGIDVTGSVTYSGDLVSSTSGTSNFRAGVNAGNSIASGAQYNTLIGDNAGTAVTTGDRNVAVGFGALQSEDANGYNVAVGYAALDALNAGADAYNVAVGYAAGNNVTTGIHNVLIGGLAGDALKDADQNVAIGHAALTADTFGHASVAIGREALVTQNFTTATNVYNVAVGHNAGQAVTTGYYNTLIGGIAGDALTDGIKNVAVGQNALGADTQGDNSVAIGVNALYTQNGVNGNVYNTAVGANAGFAVTSGYYNTIVGGLAGDLMTTGTSNTIIGFACASSGVITGANNTMMGDSAGAVLTSGASNVFIGKDAGDTVTQGSKNICIGQNSGSSSATDEHVIIIGHDINGSGNDFSFGKASNIVSNDFDTDANWSRSSDERLKKNITDQTLGLSFINDLRTVKYNWKANGELDASDAQLEHLREEDENGDIINYMNTEATMHNFIAQEVKAALDTAGVSDFGGWKEDQYGVQQVSREMFVIPLVKAVQELSAQVTALQAEVNTLKGG
jgi:cytoskeletal protein CcmA (bactofilin family)